MIALTGVVLDNKRVIETCLIVEQNSIFVFRVKMGKLEIQKEKYILSEDICDGVRSEVYYACNRYQRIYRFL